MRSTRKKWEWPSTPTSNEVIQARLLKAKDGNLNYTKQPVFGFPGTTPLESSLTASMMFQNIHANNIGFHTKEDLSEMGFEGTNTLEKEFIYSLAHLVGADSPQTDIDGYICNGGTEGNDHGMWLGRNWLLENQRLHPHDNQGVVVLTSFLTHYSVAKGFDRLFAGRPGNWHSHVLDILPTDEHGRLAPSILEKSIREYAYRGYRKFLIVLTAGTINIGSIDPVTETEALLQRLEEEFEKRLLPLKFYVHVDAAYGGLVIPFIREDVKFGFEHPHVQSISIDAHKMGYVPYPAGTFMCRKGLLDLTSTQAEYLFGHTDSTVPGSRSGGAAAACWTAMHSLGRSGYQELLKKCMELTGFLRNTFEEFGKIEPVGIYPSELNILTIRPQGALANVLANQNDFGQALFEEYYIPQINDFPSDLTQPSGPRKVGATVYRFLIMPHCEQAHLERFTEYLREEIRSHLTIQ